MGLMDCSWNRRRPKNPNGEGGRTMAMAMELLACPSFSTGDVIRATEMAMAMELLCAFNHPALRLQSNSYCFVLGGSWGFLGGFYGRQQ